MQYVPDSDDPAAIVRRYAERLATGSYLALTHATYEDESWQAGANDYKKAVANTMSRSRREVEALFAGFELVEPGVVLVEDWPFEPDTVIADPPTKFCHLGISRKP